MAPGPHEPAFFISPTGGSKTYLACAVGIAARPGGQTVAYTRMDDLARRLVIERGDGISHQKLLNELSDVDLLVIDNFPHRGHRPRSGQRPLRGSGRPGAPPAQAHRFAVRPAYWVEALPDRVAADSIVNRRAHNACQLNLGEVDMPRLRDDRARAQPDHWE
ncbi:ATP-binding protein [Pseudarthrobacter quantipunctorum]|uniref:ATP-binding protein n=1 Tax=Pseudarthrobacter quantipunctorum TaxID=3128980 RepID=A0ABZ2RG09_9MICC